MARMTSRRWAVVLFCSLAVNVFLAGMTVTNYIHRERDRALGMTVFSVPWAFRVIGNDAGSDARRVLFKYQTELAKERQNLMQDYAAVNDALTATQFDPRQVSAALAKLRENTFAAQATMHDAMADFASQLSPQQRDKLAQNVKQWAKEREAHAVRREEAIEERESKDGDK